MRLSEQCSWKLKSARIWRHAGSYSHLQFGGVFLDPEYGSSKLLSNISNYTQFYMAPHSWRLYKCCNNTYFDVILCPFWTDTLIYIFLSLTLWISIFQITYWKRVLSARSNVAQGFSETAHHFSFVCWHARFSSGGPALPNSWQACIHPHKFSCSHSGCCLNVNLFVHSEDEGSMLLWFVGKSYDPT